jgi:hypothetical protein
VVGADVTMLLAVGHHNAQFIRVSLDGLFLSVHGAEVESCGAICEGLGHPRQNLRGRHASQGIAPLYAGSGCNFLKSPRPSVVCILRRVTDAKWQPGPDSGWGMTFAGDAARRLWVILDHLDQPLNGPDGDLIARLVAEDSEPGLFRHGVEFTRRDMATALGQPRSHRAHPRSPGIGCTSTPAALKNWRIWGPAGFAPTRMSVSRAAASPDRSSPSHPYRRLCTSHGTWFGLSEFWLRPEEVEIGFHELSMCPQNGGGHHAQIGRDDENSNRVRTTA